MKENLQTIIVTGASGLVGRNFLKYARSRYIIYAINRRSQSEVGIERHPNIHWLFCDIRNKTHIVNIFLMIREKGPVDFIFHMAAYYDFDLTYKEEYHSTNVIGLKNVLGCAVIVKPGRFIFLSSVAGSKFSSGEDALSEKSPLDAEFDYAKSKCKGEELVNQYSDKFPCCSVRLAAVFTDWCEYPPLYMLINMWISGSWMSRLLAGKGKTSIPYIHIHDLNILFERIMEMSSELPQYLVLLGSPDGSTSHFKLFDAVTRYYSDRRIKPVFLPKLVAYWGIWLRYIIGRITGNMPFEKPWMAEYIDTVMNIDSSWTQEKLLWNPTSRYRIMRRLLVIVENMKNMPYQWDYINRNAIRHNEKRFNMQIYYLFYNNKDHIIDIIRSNIINSSRRDVFIHYQRISRDNLNRFLNSFYDILMASVKNNDRLLVINYIRDMVNYNNGEFIDLVEVINVFVEIGDVIISKLLKKSTDDELKKSIYDTVGITIQRVIDEIEDCYEDFYPATITDEMQETLMDIDSFYKPLN